MIEREHYQAAVDEARLAKAKGNFGVGAVIVADGNIVARGHNELWTPYFNSMAHAEMQTLNQYEKYCAEGLPRLDNTVLITTLEPCLMCLGRLIVCGIRDVRYMARDNECGSCCVLSRLPEGYDRYTEGFSLTRAECDPALLEDAREQFYGGEWDESLLYHKPRTEAVSDDGTLSAE